jgi:cytochrome c oxidase subunit 3
MYFILYFLLTGFHALHLTIGIGVLTVLAVMAHRGRFSGDYYGPMEVSGLYWHFVDIVWIFLYPLIYLIRPYQ